MLWKLSCACRSVKWKLRNSKSTPTCSTTTELPTYGLLPSASSQLRSSSSPRSRWTSTASGLSCGNSCTRKYPSTATWRLPPTTCSKKTPALWLIKSRSSPTTRMKERTATKRFRIINLQTSRLNHARWLQPIWSASAGSRTPPSDLPLQTSNKLCWRNWIFSIPSSPIR